MKKLLALAVVILGFTAVSFAQVSATATASANIITPIAIAKSTNGDMSFGNVAVSSTAGSVILSPLSARSITGGVTLPAVTGTVAAGSFDVSGTANSVYSIAITPSSVTASSGLNTMTVDTWTSTPTVAAGGLLDATTGAQVIKVGATLTVGASQPAGLYTSTPFSVTVNYN